MTTDPGTPETRDDHDGDCTVQTMRDGEPMYEPMTRDPGEWDVLVRWNRAVSLGLALHSWRLRTGRN